MSAGAELTWRWHRPPGARETPDWLHATRSLRSHVLFDGGRRPAFAPNGELDGDPDPLDRWSHHLLAERKGSVLGCIRLSSLADGRSGLVESLVGSARFARLLEQLGAEPGSVAELSRWVVTPSERGRGVGVNLLLAGFALAGHLGYRFSLAAAGTRDHQLRSVVKHCRAEIVVGLERIESDVFDDRVAIVYLDNHVLEGEVQTRFQRSAQRMGFGRASGTCRDRGVEDALVSLER